MRKYIDLMLALNKLWELCVEDIDAEISESETFDFGRARDALSDLPTIEVSEDAISREYMLKLQREVHGWMPNDKSHELWLKIKDAPSVIPKVKEGEWINKGYYAECSICGGKSGTQFDGVQPIPLKTKYCPNCGAPMKGADDE